MLAVEEVEKALGHPVQAEAAEAAMAARPELLALQTLVVVVVVVMTTNLLLLAVLASWSFVMRIPLQRLHQLQVRPQLL